MKKAIAILLSLTMILGLAACGNSASQSEQPPTEDTSVESKADTNSAENSTDMENTDNQDVQDHKVGCLLLCDRYHKGRGRAYRKWSERRHLRNRS